MTFQAPQFNSLTELYFFYRGCRFAAAPRRRRPVPSARRRLQCDAASKVSPAKPAESGRKKLAPPKDKDPAARGGSSSQAQASSASGGSGIRLENISITFKNNPVLRGVSWDVKRGERVGLVGVNGAGKTTQLQIITGALLPDAGEVIRGKESMRIAHLTQEFNVEPTRTVREEFMSAFDDQLRVLKRQDEIQAGLEACGEDMDEMGRLLGEWGARTRAGRRGAREKRAGGL
jgi:ABC-type glutathione transport system ATPase component